MKHSKIIILSISLLSIIMMSFIIKNNITLEEKENIIYMLEEEKLAYDVYQVLEEKWEHMVFTNISKAESKHFELMLDLAFAYDIENADQIEENPVGIFENKELSRLFLELSNEGANSLKEAFMVGAKIEELDIKDLRVAMDKTDNEEILNVYQRLLNGSENHLRAFARNINKLGTEYQPVILDQESFDSIINNTNQKKRGVGMNKKGQGKHNCQNSVNGQSKSGSCCKNGGDGCQKGKKS